MRFIRKGGRVIPIREALGAVGRAVRNNRANVAVGAALGASVLSVRAGAGNYEDNPPSYLRPGVKAGAILGTGVFLGRHAASVNDQVSVAKGLGLKKAVISINPVKALKSLGKHGLVGGIIGAGAAAGINRHKAKRYGRG